MRSAKAPTTSAGVMIANVIWNMANTVSGISPLSVFTPMPAISALPIPPSQALLAPPSPKARLYANSTQTMDTMQVMAKHCIRMESTFLVRTSPP